MQGRGRGIRGFMEQLCDEGGDVYEGWTASERKGSWSVCRRLETGSREWIGQRTLFKLVGQGGLANQAQSGQDYSSSNIRQGNAGLKCVSLNARSIMNKKSELNIMVNDSDPHIIGIYIIIRHCSGFGAFPRPFCVPNSVALASLTLQVGDWAIH